MLGESAAAVRRQLSAVRRLMTPDRIPESRETSDGQTSEDAEGHSGAFQYSRRLTPAFAGVRVDGAAGPLALGAKGSVRDRLTPPRRVEGSALGRYEVPFHWGGTAPYGQAPLGLEGF